MLLKVAGQNARHTSFDSAGYRDKSVTEIPRANIPGEAAPAGKDGAKKLPRPEQEIGKEDQAGNG